MLPGAVLVLGVKKSLVTRPNGRSADFIAPSTANGWTTWFWDAPDEQASYLTTASVGDFVIRPTYWSTSGVPIIDAVDTKLTTARLNTTNATTTHW